ncbi:MAG: OmpA family protein [Thiomargarita sp.]|nr:OmpA family protein [Thiomargarita sp.]
MKNLQNFLVEDNNIFGPGTDLVVSLAAVLIILIAIREIGQINLEEVRKNQMDIVNKVATHYQKKPNKKNENIYGISIDEHEKDDILIQNDIIIQTISFGSYLLFDTDKIILKESGKQVLTVVGNIFKEKLETIKEIQIQGHADSRLSTIFSSNLELAAHRAIEVFKHFQDLGIDPTRHIMSATSFGEYKPVQRRYSDMYYNSSKLEQDNDTSKKREKNRRIEVVLIYRRKY